MLTDAAAWERGDRVQFASRAPSAPKPMKPAEIRRIRTVARQPGRVRPLPVRQPQSGASRNRASAARRVQALRLLEIAKQPPAKSCCRVRDQRPALPQALPPFRLSLAGL